MPIKYGDKDTGKLELPKSEVYLFDLMKTQKEWICVICKKKICKNCYCLGSKDIKVCIDCSEKFIDNFTKSIDDLKSEAVKRLQKIKDKIEEIKKHNLASSL